MERCPESRTRLSIGGNIGATRVNWGRARSLCSEILRARRRLWHRVLWRRGVVREVVRRNQGAVGRNPEILPHGTSGRGRAAAGRARRQTVANCILRPGKVFHEILTQSLPVRRLHVPFLVLLLRSGGLLYRARRRGAASHRAPPPAQRRRRRTRVAVSATARRPGRAAQGSSAAPAQLYSDRGVESCFSSGNRFLIFRYGYGQIVPRKEGTLSVPLRMSGKPILFEQSRIPMLEIYESRFI